MPEISRLAAKRLAKKAGVTRITRPAIEKLIEAIEEHAIHTAKKALLFSKNAKRKTVDKDDVFYANQFRI